MLTQLLLVAGMTSKDQSKFSAALILSQDYARFCATQIRVQAGSGSNLAVMTVMTIDLRKEELYTSISDRKAPFLANHHTRWSGTPQTPHLNSAIWKLIPGLQLYFSMEFDGCRYDGRWLVWVLRNVGLDDARGDTLI
jgi:hypothetical protein